MCQMAAQEIKFVARAESDPRRVLKPRVVESIPTSYSGMTYDFFRRSFRSTVFYAFNVLLKWSMVRCQASLAAASSKRGVVSL
jgi:hypothetical protein